MALHRLRGLLLLMVLGGGREAHAHQPAHHVYVTGRVAEQDAHRYLAGPRGARYALVPEPTAELGSLLHVEGVLAGATPLGPVLHVQSATPVRSLRRTQFPAAAPDDLSILSVEPYSQRTLHFAKTYADMAEGVRAYLGAPAVLSSYDLEPHVMVDLHWYLEQMEQVLALLQRLDAADSTSADVAADVLELLGKTGLRSAGVKLCLGGNGKADAWDVLTHWPRLGAQCHSALKELYLRLSSLNVFLFRHNASLELSPYRHYFEQAREDELFNGRVEFPDDINGILQEAFYHLYRAAQTGQLEERQRQMGLFNLLLIGHEQMLAEPFYQAMGAQQEALAGSIILHDPLGPYPLVDQPWSSFSARMSLDLPPGTPVASVTSEMLVHNSMRPGTVPHYYHSRLHHPRAEMLFTAPLEVRSISREPAASVGAPDGASLMQRHGCLSCHRVDAAGEVGTMVGPDLSRVGGRLSSQQIREAIVAPSRSLARDPASGQPYPAGIMPVSYGKALRPEELDSLTRFLTAHR